MKVYLKFLIKTIVVFLICGSIYYGIRLVCYGEAHIIMFLLAGICSIMFINQINDFVGSDYDLFLTQIIISTALCVMGEGCCGIMVNFIHQRCIWDYSGLPGTFLFDQCNIFFIWIWFIVVIAGIVSCDAFDYYLIKCKPRPCYKINGRIIFEFKDREVL